MTIPSSISLDLLVCFFFNDTATTTIYTLSLHDALPILTVDACCILAYVTAWVAIVNAPVLAIVASPLIATSVATLRSEEHTSELQSHVNLVCRLLLEKKKALLMRRHVLRMQDRALLHYH